MAKGDNKKAQTQIDNQGRIAQAGQDALVRQLYPQQSMMYNNYLYGTGLNLNDYESMMRNYASFYNNPFGQINFGGSANPQMGGGSSFTNMQGQPINLDRNQLTQQISDAWSRIRGGQIPENELNYWLDKATNPEEYSDNKIRVGWNPYWEARMVANDTGSADPNLAGDAGVIGMGSGGGFNSIYGPGSGALEEALAGYSDFAKTGGFSPQNIQDIRARATAPIRSVYSSARRELNRGNRLGGGGAINKAAAEAKMGREQAYATSDMSTNAEAVLANLIQSGRLAGLGGLTQGGLGAGGLANAFANTRLNALNSMTGLYGTTPGLSNMFGNQVLGGQQNLINAQGLQNNLSQGLISGQINKSQIPGDFQQAMGNIGSVLDLGGRIVNPFGILGGGGNKGAMTPTYSPRVFDNIRF